METGELIYEKVFASPRPPPKISLKDNWMKELGSEVAGGGEDSQQTQPKKQKSNYKNRETYCGRATIRFKCSGNRQTCLARMRKHQRKNRETCVPVSVERLDQDKDTDENVDADQVRTVRPVGNEQSIGLFTQRDEIDIDFRVSGLPHAVVKQVENFRVRELVKKIENHHHRQDLQADLQQNNAYNTFNEKSKKNDSGRGQCRAI